MYEVPLMSPISAQRRKVVLLCAFVAVCSGLGPMLLKSHPQWTAAWMAAIVAMLIYATFQFAKLKRGARR